MNYVTSVLSFCTVGNSGAELTSVYATMHVTLGLSQSELKNLWACSKNARNIPQNTKHKNILIGILLRILLKFCQIQGHRLGIEPSCKVLAFVVHNFSCSSMLPSPSNNGLMINLCNGFPQLLRKQYRTHWISFWRFRGIGFLSGQFWNRYKFIRVLKQNIENKACKFGLRIVFWLNND